MGEDPSHPVGLEIEQAAAVGDDREFVLVGLHRDTVERLVEQIDAGRGVEGEEVFSDRRGQLRLHLVERDDDVDGLGLEPARDGAKSDQVEAEKAPGKGEIVAQEVEAAKQPVVVRDQGLAFVEADLPDHRGSAPRDNRVAERIERAEIDAAAMGEELLVEGDRVGFLSEQMKAQRADAARREA